MNIELTMEEVNALRFFCAERRWRAMLAQREAAMPHSETFIYAAEMRICETLEWKLDQALK